MGTPIPTWVLRTLTFSLTLSILSGIVLATIASIPVPNPNYVPSSLISLADLGFNLNGTVNSVTNDSFLIDWAGVAGWSPQFNLTNHFYRVYMGNSSHPTFTYCRIVAYRPWFLALYHWDYCYPAPSYGIEINTTDIIAGWDATNNWTKTFWRGKSSTTNDSNWDIYAFFQDHDLTRNNITTAINTDHECAVTLARVLPVNMGTPDFWSVAFNLWNMVNPLSLMSNFSVIVLIQQTFFWTLIAINVICVAIVLRSLIPIPLAS